MKSSRWLTFGWFALIITIWLVRGLPWNLDEYDQAKQAYTSYEMVGRGQWWFQHSPRQDSATKPPFVGWISSGIYYVTHSWHLAWRLPSLLAACGILFLLWKSGRKLSGSAGGFLATAAFAWNLLAIRLATMVRTDMSLTFFIFASGWLIWRRLQAAEKWMTSDTVWLTFLLAAATMTKGPIFHAFLLPGLIGWLFLVPRNENKVRITVGYFVASLISILPFLFWTWVRMKQDPGFYDQVVVKEFLGRFTTGVKAVHNNQTWYFYFVHLITKTFPWSGIFIVGLCLKETRVVLKKNPAFVWLVWWAIGALIAMSLVPSKRVDRIFPVIPVAALALAAMLPIFLQKSWLSARVLVSLGVLAILGYGGYTGYIVRQGYAKGLQRLVIFGDSVRKLCTANHWNYTVVEGRDEGMLMYARKYRFEDTKKAATQLKEGSIKVAIVDSTNVAKLAKKVGKLQSIMEVAHPTDKDYSYYLVRLTPAPTADTRVRFKGTGHLMGAGHNPLTCPYCSTKPRDF